MVLLDTYVYCEICCIHFQTCRMSHGFYDGTEVIVCTLWKRFKSSFLLFQLHEQIMFYFLGTCVSFMRWIYSTMDELLSTLSPLMGEVQVVHRSRMFTWNLLHNLQKFVSFIYRIFNYAANIAGCLCRMVGRWVNNLLENMFKEEDVN
jgi:hypothetical protein